MRGGFTSEEVEEIRLDIDKVFEDTSPDPIIDEEPMFRHSMLNKSAVCQKAIAQPCIKNTIFPLLGGGWF